MHLDHLASQIRVFEPFAQHIQEVGVLIPHLQHDASRIVAELPGTHRRVPAHDQLVASLPSRRLVIGCEPVPFDEIAARSNWLLLILGGKID